MNSGPSHPGPVRPLADRVDYVGEGLDEACIAATPWRQAERWVAEAVVRQRDHGDVPEPMAISVATVDPAGCANVRTVLARFFDERGVGFVTNLDSAKSYEISANPAIAATFTWPSMFRAIRFRGRAEPVVGDELRTYWQSRPRDSRLSAWASDQSRPAAGRAELVAAFERARERFAEAGDDIPVPPRWGGWRLVPGEVEFWAGRRNRLHDRLVFTRIAAGSLDDAVAWQLSRRQP